MALSRFAPPLRAPRVFILQLQSVQARASSHSAVDITNVPPEQLDNPGFFQKIQLRFKGIPLKGELHKPRSMFDDADKVWFPPEPLPEVPKDFKEHPDRDLVNFPYPARPMYPPKTRILMLPDSWFTPFYKITGVSGPYLFYGGLFAFLVNKELWVLEEQATMTMGWILFYLLLTRTIGYRVDNWLYGEYQNRMKFFKDLIAEDLKDAVEFRKTSAAETESLTAVKDAFPTIFKENLSLQLEATYRKNIQTVATELKRRVDYLQETEETKRRFERNLLLQWITDGVEKQAADPSFKEQYVSNAIAQLKGLSTTAKI